MRLRGRVAILSFVLATGACDDATGADATEEEQVAYIDGIVPHHQVASMMADEAIQKAVHAGLRTMAQGMKTDQGREVSEFKAIRVELTGSDQTPAPMQPKEIPPGPNFDRQWIMMMIDHHQGAIDMSTLAHGADIRARLDSLAHHTIDEQRREQQEMRDSLRVWYP